MTSTGKNGTIKALFENSDSVVCVLPKLDIYNLTVSNNGIDYDEWVTYIMYNGYCDTCDENIGCTRRVSQSILILTVAPLGHIVLILYYFSLVEKQQILILKSLV